MHKALPIANTEAGQAQYAHDTDLRENPRAIAGNNITDGIVGSRALTPTYGGMSFVGSYVVTCDRILFGTMMLTSDRRNHYPLIAHNLLS